MSAFTRMKALASSKEVECNGTSLGNYTAIQPELFRKIGMHKFSLHFLGTARLVTEL